MDMFTSYGHIKKPKLNHRFFMILAWACDFKRRKAEFSIFINYKPRIAFAILDL